MIARRSACLLVLLLGVALAASLRSESTIILDETAVRNLRLEVEVADQRSFETTVFAIGRIEEIPAHRSVVSSRIPGRVVDLRVFEGDFVEEGRIVARVESRRMGDPPPTVDLVAPQSGLVVTSHLRLGQPVEPEAELMDISDRSTVWAVAQVPEQEAAQVRIGTDARIHLPALGDGWIEARLARFGIEADRQTGTIEAIFVLDNPDGRLRPGMRAEFAIVLRSRPDVLAVPREAVQGDPANRVVFVKDFDLPHAFVRAPVVLGEENDRYVEVISGLFPGDEVVTRGSYGLSFSGSGGGISLKEALDAAHGHEHNEDGSERTDDPGNGRPADRTEGADDQAPGGRWLDRALPVYAGSVTLLLIIAIRQIRRRRRHRT